MRRNKKNDWNAPAIMLMMGFLLILSGCGCAVILPRLRREN